MASAGAAPEVELPAYLTGADGHTQTWRRSHAWTQSKTMGNSQASHLDPRFTSASRAFSQHELEDLRSTFVSLASRSQSNGDFVSPSVFKAYYRIDGPLGDRLFNLVTQKRGDQKLTYEDLIITKGIYEKGTKDEIDEFIYEITDLNGDGIVDRSNIEAVLAAILQNIFPDQAHEGSSHFHSRITALLNSAQFSEGEGTSDHETLSFDEFRNWCSLLPSVRRYLGGLLVSSDTARRSQVPRLLLPENSNSSVILGQDYAWLIGGALSLNELEEWKLLYHSSFNGLSFNTFLGSISNDNGPTIFIIKDKEGFIYGGYASQPWERHSDFYGDMKSFVFQLHPNVSIFRPTGANRNLQWCAVNYSSDDIPNGIGFGGRVNHFGLFLSASFDSGQTFACTTFGSPCLSKSSKIYPDVIECWGVVQKGSRGGEDSGSVKSTVLERFKEDRNMLNMVGLANSSE